MKKLILGSVLALTTATVVPVAQAADYTLRLAHFFPPVAAIHKNVAQAWADKVSADSGGRIAVEVYPSSTLAKPPALYDAVKNRIADVTLTVQGYYFVLQNVNIQRSRRKVLFHCVRFSRVVYQAVLELFYRFLKC